MVRIARRLLLPAKIYARWVSSAHTGAHSAPHGREERCILPATSSPACRSSMAAAARGRSRSGSPPIVAPGHVTGVDLNSESLAIARKAATERGNENVTFEQHHLRALPYADATFDAAFLNAVLQHVDEPRAHPPGTVPGDEARRRNPARRRRPRWFHLVARRKTDDRGASFEVQALMRQEGDVRVGKKLRALLAEPAIRDTSSSSRLSYRRRRRTEPNCLQTVPIGPTTTARSRWLRTPRSWAFPRERRWRRFRPGVAALGDGAPGAFGAGAGVRPPASSRPDVRLCGAEAREHRREHFPDVVSSYGLGILVPFAALWLGTSAIGDLVDDRLLVYLWLKPVARWQLPAAAVLATVSVVLPLTAVPLAASALAAGAGEVAPAAFLAGSFAAVAYAGLFVAAGIAFRRAVWWGLAFVLVWENVVAHTAEGAARFTVRGWAASILGLAPDVDVSQQPGLRQRRSSSSLRSPSQAGWSRRGATAAPTWTRRVTASAAGRRPGTTRRRTS